MKYGLLFSGGLDSTLCYLYLINKLNIDPDDIYLTYFPCSKYSDSEERAMLKMINMVNIKNLNFCNYLEFLSQSEKNSSFIPFRNLLFYVASSLLFINNDIKVEKIFIGGMADDRVSDNNQNFYDELNKFMKIGYPEINIEFESPVIHLSKIELLQMCYKEDWTNTKKLMDLTYSCYNPKEDGSECLACEACFRKNVALYSIDKFRTFLNDSVLLKYENSNKETMHPVRYEYTIKYIEKLKKSKS